MAKTTNKDEEKSMTFDKKNGNLFESLVVLADSLRKKGFKEEAKRLDERICNYKTAEGEVHLYQTFEETGDDLLDSAHPDGDLALCPAKDNMGDIETLQSQHKKILKMLEKAPTGKLSSIGPEDLKKNLAMLVTLENIEKKIEKITKQNKVEEIVKQTAMVLGLEKVAWEGVFPKIPTVEEAVQYGKDQSDIITIYEFNSSMNEMRKVINETTELLGNRNFVKLDEKYRLALSNNREKASMFFKNLAEGFKDNRTGIRGNKKGHLANVQGALSEFSAGTAAEMDAKAFSWANKAYNYIINIKNYLNKQSSISEQELLKTSEWGWFGPEPEKITGRFSPKIENPEELERQLTPAKDLVSLNSFIVSLSQMQSVAIEIENLIKHKNYSKLDERIRTALNNNRHSATVYIRNIQDVFGDQKDVPFFKIKERLGSTYGNTASEIDTKATTWAVKAKQYNNQVSSYLTKIGNVKSLLVKSAEFPKKNDNDPDMPELPAQGQGAPKQSPAVAPQIGPDVPVTTTGEPIERKSPPKNLALSGDEKVKTMQGLLLKIADWISSNITEASKRFPNTIGLDNKAEQVIEIIRKVSGSAKYSPTELPDGLWGPKTDASIMKVNELITESNNAKKTQLPILSNNKGTGFMYNPKVASEQAGQNSATLNDFIQSLIKGDISGKPGEVQQKSYKFPFDGKDLIITDNDLSSLKNFYAFLATNHIAQKAEQAYTAAVGREQAAKPAEEKAQADKALLDEQAKRNYALTHPGEPPKSAGISIEQIAMIKKAMTPRADHWKPIWAYGADYVPGAGPQYGLNKAQWLAAFDMVQQATNKKIQAGQEVPEMMELNKKFALLGTQLMNYLNDQVKSGQPQETVDAMKVSELPESYDAPLSSGNGRSAGRPMSVEEYASALAKKYHGRISPEDLQGFVDSYSTKLQHGDMEGVGFGPGSMPMKYPPITTEAIFFNHPLWKGTAFPTITSKLMMSQIVNYQFNSDKALDLATLWANRLSRAYGGRASQALFTFLSELSKKIAEVSMQYNEQFSNTTDDRPAQQVMAAAETWQTALSNIMKALRGGQGDVQQAQKRY